MKLVGMEYRHLLVFLLLLTICLFIASYFSSTVNRFSTQNIHQRFIIPVDPERKEDTHTEIVNGSIKRKLILAYTTVYSNNLSTSIWGIKRALKECKYTCDWSTEKTDYNKSDAVIFHLYNMQSHGNARGQGEFVISKLPTRYNIDQKWILIGREPSAFYFPQQLQLLNDMFNLTMTYQSDSDIHIPYGRFVQLKPQNLVKHKKVYDQLLKKEGNGILWLASNCVTSSRREDYVTDMQKYIHIDVYGKCAGKNSRRNNSVSRKQTASQYKFYLAFENSDCDDYVTEKLFESLRSGMIPIVRGRRVDYKRICPPNSYIHADDFSTPQLLADFINKVAYNITLLERYHRWRLTYDVPRSHLLSVNDNWSCDLCKKVHTSARKTVDIYRHFSEDTRCYTIDRNRTRTGEHMKNLEDIPFPE